MKKLMLSLLVLLCGTAFAQNHWTPNTEPYEDYMAMIVVVEIDGVEQALTTLEIGAFCGDECRGSAVAAYFPPTSRYLYQLLVYCNTGDVVTFKLYDHEQQQEREGLVVDEVTCSDEGYGSLSNPYVMSFTTVSPQQEGLVIELYPGWNWISYLLLTEHTVEEAFAGLAPADGDIIKSPNSYCTYKAGTGRWIGDLVNLTPGRGLHYLNTTSETKTFSFPKENH